MVKQGARTDGSAQATVEEQPPSALPPDVFVAAVEQAPVAISVTDRQARILYANREFERLTGYSEDEVIGRNESLLSDRSTPAIVYEALWSSMMRRRAWTGRLLNRRRSGQRYLAELTVAPVLDEDGQTTHYLGLHRDVTDQYRLEREVQNQRGLIQALMDHAPLLVVALDAGWKVMEANASFRAAERSCASQATLSTLLADGAADAAAVARGQLFEEQAEVPEWEQELPVGINGEGRIFACSGRWLEVSDASADGFFERRGRRYLLVFASDITGLRREQERVRMNALRALLAEEERAQSLQESLGAATYRLEVPLNRLETTLRMAEAGPAEHRVDELASLAEDLQEAVRQGREALESLRASVPTPPQAPFAATNLNEVIHDVLQLGAADLFALDIVVDWTPASLPHVIGQELRLRAALKQLLDNAMQAMGGSLDREIRISTSQAGERLLLRVEDTGPGIPEHLHLRVFEPFFTVAAADQGEGRPRGRRPGMGLTMVQDVVQRHAGVVYVDGEYGDGCAIVVELPLERRGSVEEAR